MGSTSVEEQTNLKARTFPGSRSRSLAEEIDTNTSAGRLIFHVFASIAEFERERGRRNQPQGDGG